MEKTVPVQISVLENMRNLLSSAADSSAVALWVCGALYASVDLIIKEAELNETV